MRARTLNLGQRAFLRTMHTLSELSEGYTVGFLDELVRQHGIGGFFKWAKRTSALWNELAARYGERDAHLIASFASIWNGCDYCAYGHLLAFNLEYYEQRGELFPLDEADVPRLLRMRDPEILDVVRRHFRAAKEEGLLALLERQHALKTGEAKAERPEDLFLMRAAALYEWVNECSIMVEAPAPPLGRVAKKRALRFRYDAARAAQRTASLPHESVPPAPAAAGSRG